MTAPPSVMLFSVIIPTFNRRDLLKRTLDSIRPREDAGHEIIVIDDGSTDGTTDMLAADHPDARVLKQSHAGPGAARNRGIREARGDYAAFLDSDDLWFPWTLEVYARAVARHDRPAFIAGRPLPFATEAGPDGARPEAADTLPFPDYLASGDEWRWWGVSSFVVRLDALRATDGFLEGDVNGEDCDLALKLGTARGFVQVTAPPTFGYREHAGGIAADPARSFRGIHRLIATEKAGRYPGGAGRARERRRIITRHARPVALACARAGMLREALALYAATFSWHLRLGRLKFLAGFPPAALLSRLRPRARR